MFELRLHDVDCGCRVVDGVAIWNDKSLKLGLAQPEVRSGAEIRVSIAGEGLQYTCNGTWRPPFKTLGDHVDQEIGIIGGVLTGRY